MTAAWRRGSRDRMGLGPAVRAAAAAGLAALFMGLGGGPAPETAPPLRGVFAPADQPAQYLSNRLYHLKHLRLDLAFDLRRGHVEGTATQTLSPLQPGLTT